MNQAEQLSSPARAQDRLHDMYEAVLSRNMDLSVVLGLIVSTTPKPWTTPPWTGC